MWPLTQSFHLLALFLGVVALGSLLQENRITDTTAAEARRGKDIQGIPWDSLSISREKYRQTRIEQYKNYENIRQSGELSEKVKYVFLRVPKHLNNDFEEIFWPYAFSLVYRNANLQIKGECIMISGKTLDLWSQRYFISKYVNISNSLLLFMCRCDKICLVYTPCYLFSCGKTCACVYTGVYTQWHTWPQKILVVWYTQIDMWMWMSVCCCIALISIIHNADTGSMLLDDLCGAFLF